MRALMTFLMTAIVIASIAFGSGATGQDGRAHEHGGRSATAAAERTNGAAFARALHSAMAQMHADMMRSAPTGDPDRDFLAAMIPHHQGAIEMARLLLLAGKDPLVRQLAAEIIATQQSEITAMSMRLAILSAGADPQPGGFPALGGVRGK